MTKLLGFNYEIHYKTRNENLNVDVLSRIARAIPLGEEALSQNDQKWQCNVILYPYGGWMDELRRFNEQDEWIMQKVQQLVQESSTTTTRAPTLQSKYHLVNRFLKYKARVVLSHTSS